VGSENFSSWQILLNYSKNLSKSTIVNPTGLFQILLFSIQQVYWKITIVNKMPRQKGKRRVSGSPQGYGNEYAIMK